MRRLLLSTRLCGPREALISPITLAYPPTLGYVFGSLNPCRTRRVPAALLDPPRSAAHLVHASSIDSSAFAGRRYTAGLGRHCLSAGCSLRLRAIRSRHRSFDRLLDMLVGFSARYASHTVHAFLPHTSLSPWLATENPTPLSAYFLVLFSR
jgi:hypothetical protein